MHVLTKPEELLMLAVCNLGDNAYGVEILKFVSEKTGKEWSIGSIYVPLDRLVRLRFLETFQGEPTSKRGGKSKRFYRITKEGTATLLANRKIHDDMWGGVPAKIAGDHTV